MLLSTPPTPASSSGSWKFLKAAPPHYTSFRLRKDESIDIDGRLDDAAWSAPGVEWTMPMVDITHHPLAPERDVVPSSLQARAKVRWDDEFLYVGVELREPFIFANVTGHNGPTPPYHDNDVELFVDASGTTQYYKEFELSARNATYDVLWGVPDGEGLLCSPSSAAASASGLPICVNTSFPGYAGDWTMATRSGGAGGLASATHFRAKDYGKWVGPYAVWTTEIAFPLRSAGRGDSWHGGLLDAGPPYPNDSFISADPSRAHRTHGGPVYWHFDLSRAEHPRRYTKPGGGENVYCPLGCAHEDLTSWKPQLEPLSHAECAAVRAKWPTLLGLDPWNCYWEWALADVGAAAYMHRPLNWATLQFADAPAAPVQPPTASDVNVTCGLIEWPGRYVARQLFLAQRAALKRHGTFTNLTSELVDSCQASDGCVASDLRDALSASHIFRVAIVLDNRTSSMPCGLPAPCFKARVSVVVPAQEVGNGKEPYRYATFIDSNSKVVTERETAGDPPCLFTSASNSLRPAELL